MRKPRQILLCVFVFIKNTSNYKIKVKQMIFYARFPDYSSSLTDIFMHTGITINFFIQIISLIKSMYTNI